MRSFLSSVLKLSLVLPTAIVAPPAILAQTGAQEKGRIRLESLDRLSPRARKAVDVDIDGSLIKVATLILSDEDEEEKTIKELALSLKGVYVRRFDFTNSAQYEESDLADLRAQLNGAGWSKLVDISGGRDGWDIEDAEIYVASSGGKVDGIVILAAQRTSLTVANIVGMVDIEKIRRLGGTLGIPRIRIRKRDVIITNENKKP
jgi:hypothetical protein